jgi:hypothetical protein
MNANARQQRREHPGVTAHPRPQIALGLLFFAVSGCTNPPDGLRMALVLDQPACPPTLPLRLNATFSASGGTVCIVRPTANMFDFEVMQDDSSETLSRTKIAHCGTPYPWVILVYPFLAAGCLLDVADTAGRYVVLEDGDDYSYPIDLIITDDGFIAMSPDDPDYEDRKVNQPPWPPGQYRVRARFVSRTWWAYPAPLFWTVYDQPVAATTAATIAMSEPRPTPIQAWIDLPYPAQHRPIVGSPHSGHTPLLLPARS